MAFGSCHDIPSFTLHQLVIVIHGQGKELRRVACTIIKKGKWKLARTALQALFFLFSPFKLMYFCCSSQVRCE